MGKIHCFSSKTRENYTTVDDYLLLSLNKPMSWYEKKIADEYKRLKNSFEGKGKVNAFEEKYGLSNYKVRLNRLIKWSRIVYSSRKEVNDAPKDTKDIEVCFELSNIYLDSGSTSNSNFRNLSGSIWRSDCIQ